MASGNTALKCSFKKQYHGTGCHLSFRLWKGYDVTSKVGDHVKFDEASPFFLVNLCQHKNKKNVISTIMKTMILSSFLCIFAKY